jgi:short-subunit dehydrogenase
MSARFSPLVIVLTGASSGIGRATAQALASYGCVLVLAARGREALAKVAEECEQRGARAIIVPTDITDPNAVRALAGTAIGQFGHIDVWINNVGVGALGRFEDTPLEAHQQVVNVNLMGHIHGAHAILPHFRQRGRGTLINMISVGGWASAPYAAAYTASKFGLRGFSESLRAELSNVPDVHVCDVYPSFVNTPGVSHGANYTGRQVKPVPPLLDPHRVASAIVSLIDHPRAIVTVGGTAHMVRLTRALGTNLRGRIMRWLVDAALRRASATPATPGNLFAPSRGHAISGEYRRSVTPYLAGITVLALGFPWIAHARRRP